jgi:hypothetical protein
VSRNRAIYPRRIGDADKHHTLNAGLFRSHKEPQGIFHRLRMANSRMIEAITRCDSRIFAVLTKADSIGKYHHGGR